MTEAVSDSRFYMWRAIFAMAHADGIVTEEESRFMNKALQSESFSEPQRRILEDDIKTPQDVAAMFMKIGEQEDRSRFFYFARILCWSDGDFGEQEQKIMLTLKKIHVSNVNFDQILESLDMELDEEHKEMLEEDMSGGRENAIINFFKRFK